MDLNDLYVVYTEAPTDESFINLYYGLIRYAKNIARKLFAGQDLPDWQDECNDAATNVMMAFDKFDTSKAKFTTWVHMQIRHDLINWINKLHLEHIPLDDERAISIPAPEMSGPEKQFLLKEAFSLLSDKERELWQLRVDGMEFKDIATKWGVTERTIYRLWKVLKESLIEYGE